MYKYLSFFLIFLISFNINANEDCNSSDPDLTALCNTLDEGNEALDTMLKLAAVGGVVLIGMAATGAGAIAGEVIKEDDSSFTYEFAGDKIIFQGDHRLENLEVNFSNPIKKSQYQQFLQINEEHYIGLTWRF
tara:strand:+ start:217 stop:615 length:399 start_codon:yes stop_codon:yes gene_type:complete